MSGNVQSSRLLKSRELQIEKELRTLQLLRLPSSLAYFTDYRENAIPMAGNKVTNGMYAQMSIRPGRLVHRPGSFEQE